MTGFIPKAFFLEQMMNDRDSVNAFLVVSMLSISARFTPELRMRFGDSNKASEFFVEVAHVMIPSEMYNITLENTQAFFLLGMADWGKGDRHSSTVSVSKQISFFLY